MENENELQDSTKPENEDLDSLPEANIQEGDTDEEKFAKLEVANKKLFARAKKAEEEAKALKTKPHEPEKEVPKVQPQDNFDKLIEEKLNERDLSSMDLSDTLKSEVKAYAKAKGVPYREAANSDYVSFLKQKETERLTAEDASATTKGVGIKAKRDFASLGDDIASLSDEEFKEYKQWVKSQE
jgi:hypothetical protein